MNNFVVIEELEDFTFKKVKYYSVRFMDNDNELNEFYDFLVRMNQKSEIYNDLSNLIAWIEDIGDNDGAREILFRHEGAADALPPPKQQMKAAYLELDENLRLYCLRANENLVFLFNGDIKTTQKAQDCPNVRLYFNQANRLAKAINTLFQNNQIKWNSAFTDIILDDDLEFEI